MKKFRHLLLLFCTKMVAISTIANPISESEIRMKEIVTELVMEVNNGGFNQYFYNSSGDNAVETLKVLKTVGAVKTAALLSEAINLFPDNLILKNRDNRQEVLERIDPDEELFGSLDTKFWNLSENAEDLVDKFLNFH